MDRTGSFSTSSTAWQVMAIDYTTGVLTGYSTLAALNAAGAVAFPGLDPGMQAAHLVLKTEDNSDGAKAGSGFYFTVNRGAEFSNLSTDAARDKLGTEVDGGVTFTYPGVNPVSTIPISNVWVRKTTSTDVLHLTAIY